LSFINDEQTKTEKPSQQSTSHHWELVSTMCMKQKNNKAAAQYTSQDWHLKKISW